MKRRFADLRRDQRGQSLLIIVGAMTLLLGMAALAIDVASWYQKHHQAQVAADSAALAAANCMFYAGETIGTVPNACVSPTDTQDAQTVATNIASNDGTPIPGSDVTFNSGTVTVTTPTTAPDFFASKFGFSNTPVSARAVATWINQDCSSAGSRCAFIFANDNSCSGTTGVVGQVNGQTNQTSAIPHGITIFDSGGGAGNLTGAVISNSSISTSVNGNASWSAEAANPKNDDSTGNGTGNICTGPLSAGQSDPYSGTSTRTVPNTYPIDWPVNYSNIYPACSTTCDSQNFPSYCTVDIIGQSTYTISSTTANAVYCNPGTGNTKDPSTWTGTITQTSGGQNQTIAATYIAGVVNFSLPSNTTLKPAANSNLLAYAAECNRGTTAPAAAAPPPTCNSQTTTSPAITVSTNGNPTLQGDMFAPAGTIDAGFGGNPVAGTFLEGWDVVYIENGNVFGGGPTVTATGQIVGDFLIQ